MSLNHIVFIGDSMALPKPEFSVDIEDTYPYLLMKKDASNLYFIRNRRKNSVKEQSKEFFIKNDMINFKPTYVIISHGIVDCAPRLFTKKQQKMLSWFNSRFRNLIIKNLAKHRFFITKNFPKVYVDIKSFERCLRTIVNAAISINSTPILIGISRTSEVNIKKSYNINKNIMDYNDIIKKLSIEMNLSFVDAYNLKLELVDDGIHYTKESHQTIANVLNPLINKEID